MKKAAALLLVLFASAGLAACGSSSDDSGTTTGSDSATQGAGGGKSPGGKGGALDIAAADSGLAYASDTASAPAGRVTVSFDNPQALAHDVAFEDEAGDTIGKTGVITEGSDSTDVDLQPGTYQFYCTVPGHREAGMEGTLTVK